MAVHDHRSSNLFIGNHLDDISTTQKKSQRLLEAVLWTNGSEKSGYGCLETIFHCCPEGKPLTDEMKNEKKKNIESKHF